TLFHLVFLNFMKPSFTDEGWNSLIIQYMTLTESRANSPEQNFSDLVKELLYGDNIRRKNMSTEIIGEMKQDVSEDIYRERFADAGDFTFVFVGSFDTDELKELAERYIAVLPSAGQREEARYVGSGFPRGITEGAVRAGIDPKSRVFMAFGGQTSFSDGLEYERFDALISLMNIRLREVIREDMGGTYGVQVYGSLSGYPDQRFSVMIEFGCEPGREDSLSEAILSEIASFRNTPVAGSYMTKLSESFRRTQEEGLKNNQSWLQKIVNFTIQGRPLASIPDTKAVLALFTPQSLQAAAGRYLSTDNYVRAYLMPAEQ
ncbi:MAG: insulinase family protein, partial [Spirochaetaceae bacterium]|nr:insulinase family protein [Spirochaetaceae bacterium]